MPFSGPSSACLAVPDLASGPAPAMDFTVFADSCESVSPLLEHMRALRLGLTDPSFSKLRPKLVLDAPLHLVVAATGSQHAACLRSLQEATHGTQQPFSIRIVDPAVYPAHPTSSADETRVASLMLASTLRVNGHPETHQESHLRLVAPAATLLDRGAEAFTALLWECASQAEVKPPPDLPPPLPGSSAAQPPSVLAIGSRRAAYLVQAVLEHDLKRSPWATEAWHGARAWQPSAPPNQAAKAWAWFTTTARAWAMAMRSPCSVVTVQSDSGDPKPERVACGRMPAGNVSTRQLTSLPAYKPVLGGHSPPHPIGAPSHPAPFFGPGELAVVDGLARDAVAGAAATALAIHQLRADRESAQATLNGTCLYVPTWLGRSFWCSPWQRSLAESARALQERQKEQVADQYRVSQMTVAACTVRKSTKGDGTRTLPPAVAALATDEACRGVEACAAGEACLAWDAPQCAVASGQWKFHVYPARHAAGTGMSDVMRQLRKVLAAHPRATSDPEQACLFFVPLDTLDRDLLSPLYGGGKLEEHLWTLPQWNARGQGAGSNHIVLNWYTGAFPEYAPWSDLRLGRAVFASAAHTQSTLREGHDIVLPHVNLHALRKGAGAVSWWRQEALEAALTGSWLCSAAGAVAGSCGGMLAPDQRSTLVSFKGSAYIEDQGVERLQLWGLRQHRGWEHIHLQCDHGQQLVALRERGSPMAQATCAEAMDDWAASDPFQALLRDSTFSLVPSGRRQASYRLTEVMAAGSIPVTLGTGLRLPFEEVLDWDAMSVHKHGWKDVGKLPGLLAQLAADGRTMASMQAACVQAYQAHLASMEAIADTLLLVLDRRREQAGATAAGKG